MCLLKIDVLSPQDTQFGKSGREAREVVSLRAAVQFLV